MAWSTRELAQLCGTSVSAIRHYHRLGLLDSPERRSNGYKQYGVDHLVAVLRIRRYADLGVPLAQIGKVSADESGTETTLRALDGELASRIEQMALARRNIAAILDGRASLALPSGFEVHTDRLSDADRSMVHVFAQLFDGQALADLQTIVETDDNDAGADFDDLAADADDATRRRIAEQLAPAIAGYLRDYPWLTDPVEHQSRRARLPERALTDAVAELCNSAQLDVLARARVLADALLRRDSNEASLPSADRAR